MRRRPAWVTHQTAKDSDSMSRTKPKQTTMDCTGNTTQGQRAHLAPITCMALSQPLALQIVKEIS